MNYVQWAGFLPLTSVKQQCCLFLNILGNLPQTITMTSSWARWRLKSPASWLFTQPFINAQNHQSSTSLAFVWGIHRWPVNSPHKGPVTRKMFPFDDVIMFTKVNEILATCHFDNFMSDFKYLKWNIKSRFKWKLYGFLICKYVCPLFITCR